MRTQLLVLLFILFGVEVSANQKEHDYQVNFNIAKQHLSQRRVIKAIPYLQYLHNLYPDNANVKYLLGVCYVEGEIINPESISLLEEATQKVSLEYDPNTINEDRSPVYVFYYLSLALAQQHQCQEAEVARAKFLEIYPHDDPYYTEESKRWIKKCQKLSAKPEPTEIPSFPDFKPFTSKPQVQVEAIDGTSSEAPKLFDTPANAETKTSFPKDTTQKDVLTKSIYYSTTTPLYGVQLGAYKEVIPVSRFRELKNVDAFMDTNGLIRYVVGHFSIHSQAMSLLEGIQSMGYPDAFIVNVNDAKKFSEEVVSVNNVNIRASLTGKVEYKVQLGAFTEKIPPKTVKMYFEVEGLEEVRDQEYTYLTVGAFSSYQEAKQAEQKYQTQGYEDSFVIAVSQGRKISLQQAKEFNP